MLVPHNDAHTRIDRRTYLAIDIGGTKCAVSLAGGDGVIHRRREFETAAFRDPSAVLDTIIDLGRELCDRRVGDGSAPASPVGAGISCGGPLDRLTGRILGPPNLPGWDDVPIVAYLSDKLALPVHLENDANAGAMAEWRFGAGRGCSNIVFLTFGTGMGAGLILNGAIYRGTNDLAGEIGHVRLSETGPVGFGKEGSFEGYCSGGGIGRAATSMARRSDPDATEMSARDVVEAVNAGDAAALHVIEESARHLGRGLAILVDVLNPQRIIIGSVYARNESFFRDAAIAELKREALPGAVATCEIVPAELGERIGDLAALSVAIEGDTR